MIHFMSNKKMIEWASNVALTRKHKHEDINVYIHSNRYLQNIILIVKES